MIKIQGEINVQLNMTQLKQLTADVPGLANGANGALSDRQLRGGDKSGSDDIDGRGRTFLQICRAIEPGADAAGQGERISSIAISAPS